MATKTNEITANIKPLDIRTLDVRIVGDTPLIVHAWSDKAKKMMLDNQTKATKTKAKEPRKPFQEFVDALYWITNKPDSITQKKFEQAVADGAKFGFPVGAIKLATNSAAYRLGWVKNQMGLRGAYFLRTPNNNNLAEIKGAVPEMREDMVRIGKGTADLRYRPEFKNWYMDFTLEYNASGDLTLEQILNCINAGGCACGIGEWRSEKDGDYGRYHIEVM